MEQSSAGTLSQAAVRRPVSIEFRKCIARWERDGLMAKFLSGEHVLDIGFRGRDASAVPVTESAIGIERGYPGYDGTHLPFADNSQDAVFSSAVFEHIPNYREVLAEWYRVLKVGGFIIILVPNKYLYERRPDLPSRWNGDHRRFFTPASLLKEIEESLPHNGFRVRHLFDDDHGYRYDGALDMHPVGCYQIEMVIERINRPPYSDNLEYPSHIKKSIEDLDGIIIDSIALAVENPGTVSALPALFRSIRYFPPFRKLSTYFVYSDPPKLGGRRLSLNELRTVIRPFLDLVEVDEQMYLQHHKDLKQVGDPTLHWRSHGYFEGRAGNSFEFQF
jgi:SAM-dependent methyltransferase